MSFYSNIKKDFTLMAILLMPVAIAMNAVIGNIVAFLKIPIFGDQIGTILIAVIAGPWVGLVTGLLTNFINAIFDPTWIPYSLVAMAIGLSAGFLSKIGMFKTPFKVIISGLIIALIAGLTTTPIKAFIFGGASTGGSAIVTGAFLASGSSLFMSVFFSSILTDLADKLVSVFVVYFLIKSMPARYLAKFHYGQQFIKNKPQIEE
jgi:energy-coupling factor transport system substrate-specific component